MLNFVRGGALFLCVVADDEPDTSSLLQRRELSQTKAKICADDPNCIPIDTQCCADWINDQEDGCGNGYTPITTGTTECIGTCQRDHCCHQSCAGALGGSCPDNHSPKFDDLSTESCASCSAESAIDACCEEHGQCPACTGGKVQVKPEGSYCNGVDCGTHECCKPSCENRLTGGVCPAGHSAKVNLGETVCFGHSCDPVDTCCEEHEQCPTCSGGEMQVKDAGSYCTGVNCGAKECCKPTCKSRLTGGVCPAGHSAKVDLANTLCVGDNCDPEETCCEEHEQCPTCPAGEMQVKDAGTSCTGVNCGAQECCQPTCESRLIGGTCPAGHSAKVDLSNTLCVGDSCNPVDTCCEEHEQCPACSGGMKQVKDEGTYCNGVNCGSQECCRPTCASKLTDGVCPAGHSAKVDLADTLCVGSCDAVETCCEEHEQCPACSGGEMQVKDAGTYCTGVNCGSQECCRPTCESMLPNGVCPAHHTAKGNLGTTLCVGNCGSNPVDTCCDEHEQCPTCNANEIQKKTGHCDGVSCADDECCDPATCGNTLSKPCDEIVHHTWASGHSSMSPCSVGGQPCTAAQAFGKCCDAPEASVTAPQMKYCTLYGDPHIRTFDGKDQNNGGYPPLYNNDAYRAGVFWLVNHPDVKIQARFGTSSENGGSRLLGLGIDVKGVNVWMDNSPTNVKVKGSGVGTVLNGLSMGAWHTISEDGFEQVKIQRRSTPPYTSTGTHNVQLQSQNPNKAFYYRFPGFSDHTGGRSYVEVYVQGRGGHLDAAIYMMRAEDFVSREMSGTITGLCGNSNGVANDDYTFTQNGNSEVGSSLAAFTVSNDVSAESTQVCTASQKQHWRGRCDSCVSSSCPDREEYIEECAIDYCLGEQQDFVDMDCAFINDIACQH